MYFFDFRHQRPNICYHNLGNIISVFLILNCRRVSIRNTLVCFYNYNRGIISLILWWTKHKYSVHSRFLGWWKGWWFFGFIIWNTGCIKKMVIELWSALARSLYNLQKSFFNSRKDQAFSFRMSPFLWNLKKDWANTNQMEIAGRNHIFPPLSIIMAANKKRKFH